LFTKKKNWSAVTYTETSVTEKKFQNIDLRLNKRQISAWIGTSFKFIRSIEVLSL